MTKPLWQTFYEMSPEQEAAEQKEYSRRQIANETTDVERHERIMVWTIARELRRLRKQQRTLGDKIYSEQKRRPRHPRTSVSIKQPRGDRQ